MANNPAVEGPFVLQIPGLYGEEDFSAYQFHFVKYHATEENRVIAIADDGDFPVGILQNNPNVALHTSEVGASAEMQVVTLGVSKLVAGEDWSSTAPGTWIGPKGDGTGQVATTGDWAFGWIQNGCGAGGVATVVLAGPHIAP